METALQQAAYQTNRQIEAMEACEPSSYADRVYFRKAPTIQQMLRDRLGVEPTTYYLLREGDSDPLGCVITVPGAAGVLLRRYPPLPQRLWSLGIWDYVPHQYAEWWTTLRGVAYASIAR